VAQLLESATFPLKDGTLDLIVDADAVTLGLAGLAFPLSPNTPVFTHSENPLWYFFRGPTGASGSYVRITLPPESATQGTEDQKLRDRFEDTLLQAGLLNTRIDDAGDEIGAGLKEDAVWVSQWIQSEAAAYDASHLLTDEPMTFSSSVQSLATSASTGSAAAAGYASSAAQAIARATIGVGSRAFSLFGGAGEAPARTPDVEEKLHSDLSEAGYSEADPVPTARPHPLDLSPLVQDAKAGAARTLNPVVNAARSAVGGLVQGENEAPKPQT
jgi:hypothetical protein